MRRWSVTWMPILAFIACFPGESVAAPEIAVTGGSLRLSPASGRLLLEGDRGFTLDASVSAAGGVFEPYSVCNLLGGPCSPGDALSLRALWTGGDVRGSATLDGVAYPALGGDAASVSVELSGSALLPPLAASAEVVAPFSLRGTFFRAEGAESLRGRGIAVIALVPNAGVPGRWQIEEVRYEIGGALPAPWVSADIGSTGVPGSAVFDADRFAVSGAGADIWGTTDSFHFAYRAGANLISARVLSQGHTHPFAKAGVMLRESVDADAASVVLDAKPNGEVEFMIRYAPGDPTIYVGGAVAVAPAVFLRLERGPGNTIVASQSANGTTWREVGTAIVPFAGADILGGLAVTSHDRSVLNDALFDHASTVLAGSGSNLLAQGDFEGYRPPALGPPGWISDHAVRQVPAKSEAHQPRSGLRNGACWTSEPLDCGLYQEIVAPATGLYTLRVHATSDRPGGLVGANVNGRLAASETVAPRGFAAYGTPYVMTLSASLGDIIKVWMYSPASPGYVVVDDVSLELSAADLSK
ncbi:MAG: hypothetical protein AB7Q29_09845 [Vicinamibacterales bacterium]